MRKCRWCMALALALGLWLSAYARADDDEAKAPKTGNWFTRLFSRNTDSKKTEKTGKKDDTSSAVAVSPALARQKAQWELMRRQEVCDRLRQIAADTGDQELSRKADALDQRAWDVYLQKTGGVKSDLTPEEQFLDSRLGMQAQRLREPSAADGVTSAADGRAAARKD